MAVKFKVWYREGHSRAQLIAYGLDRVGADYLVNSLSMQKRAHGLKGQYFVKAEGKVRSGNQTV